jgi:hypothetical protein
MGVGCRVVDGLGVGRTGWAVCGIFEPARGHLLESLHQSKHEAMLDLEAFCQLLRDLVRF